MKRLSRQSVHTTLATAAALLIWASPAAADGEAPIAHGLTGNYEITVLVSPIPVSVGETRWTVLVRNRNTGVLGVERSDDLLLILETAATMPSALRIVPPLERLPTEPPLYTARIDLPSSGLWRGQVAVQSAGGPASLRFDVPVDPARGIMGEHWPSLALAPVTLACFSLHQWLVRRRRTPRRPR